MLRLRNVFKDLKRLKTKKNRQKKTVTTTLKQANKRDLLKQN